jgi:hypothetical protein
MLIKTKKNTRNKFNKTKKGGGKGVKGMKGSESIKTQYIPKATTTQLIQQYKTLSPLAHENKLNKTRIIQQLIFKRSGKAGPKYTSQQPNYHHNNIKDMNNHIKRMNNIYITDLVKHKKNSSFVSRFKKAFTPSVSKVTTRQLTQNELNNQARKEQAFRAAVLV